MPRQRASAAHKAFARVGAAQVPPVPADQEPGENDSLSASGKDGTIASATDIGNDSANSGGNVGGNAAVKASVKAGETAGTRAGRSAGRKAGKTRRRVGRPRGPERVPVTVRFLAETNDRLTAAVDVTGESPQYIVERALTAYLDALGVPPVSRRPASA